MPNRHVLEWLATAALLAAVGLWLGWPFLRAEKMQDDLDYYAQQIRHCPCPLAVKEELLDRVEALEDALRAGHSVGWRRWERADKAIREMLKPEINDDTSRLIERELRRVQREMAETSKGREP
jgi:hypothetical protein